ncbi:dihydrofolate reductase family protein [Phenylobacterium sp.]|uniref:dihydrofolate reductase family protein n=1 Tax=Phenylobacterium sp. TaxID=1871053 RepID=UPI0039832E33
MKIVHYMSLTADGHVVQAASSGGIPPVILADFMGRVAEAGALVLGRRTYDLFHAMGAIGAIPGQVVVLSHALPASQPGVTVKRSPDEALSHLADQGLSAAIVGGGPEIYSAFLAQGLIDELCLNLTPAMDGAGLTIATPSPMPLHLELTAVAELGDGIVQLRYRRGA